MSDEEESRNTYKIILLGDSSVGKTAIIQRFFQNDFQENHITTIGVDFRFKNVDIDGTVVSLQVWDTAGSERFRTITSSYYRGADAVIIVYAVDCTETFQNVCTWIKDIDEHVSWPLVKYLVGNKADLEDERCIEEKTGKREADSYGIKFMETSAKTSQNIEELFMGIARDIKMNEKPALEDRAEVHERIVLEESDPSTESNPKSKGCCRR